MPEQYIDVNFPRTAQVQVYITVGNQQETILFHSDISNEEIKELFRSAAEAGPNDVIKLFNSSGQLLNISSDLPANTPETRYSLKVVAVDGLASGIFFESTCSQIKELEARITDIERQLQHELPLPDDVKKLQEQVDLFRQKLETCKNLSWMGFYKNLPDPLPENRILQYRRKSDTIKRKVRQNFLKICDSQVSDTIKEWLKMPTFDCRQWEDEELLLLLQQMYLDLDLCTKFAINITTLRNFLYETYKNYNDVPFHNFRHSFCVAQMMYSITWCVDLPTKIGDLEVLILLTSCICHDLDHPGFNNIYQINARTELAIRYNDISPLENHHCSIAFRILENENCNIFQSFSVEMYKQVREGIIRCILATDMARHNEILQQFKEIIPEFDYTNKAHVNLLSMVLIKVSDISNEARPMDVAEPWLDKLLQEFFKQSDTEKLEGLPVTPFMDRDKITKPSSQCSFIGFVLLPLFEALGELFIELQELIVHPVKEALHYYRKLNDASKEEKNHHRDSNSEHVEHSEDNTPKFMSKSNSNTSINVKKSQSFQNHCGSEIVTENRENFDVKTESFEDILETLEQLNEPTEVEVSEKALKFKISTDTLASGRKSYPSSRKGSTEKVINMNNADFVKILRREKGKLRAGMLSFDHNYILSEKQMSTESRDIMDKINKNFAMNRYDTDNNDCVISGETLNLNKRNSYDYVKPYIPDEKISQLKNNEYWSFPNIEKSKMSSLYSSPSHSPRPRSTSVAETIDQPTNLREHRKMSLLKNIKKSFTTKAFQSMDSLPSEQKSQSNPIQSDPEPVEGISKTNQSIISRLRHFSEKIGLKVDKDIKSVPREHGNSQNNICKRMTLTLRRNKPDSACSHSFENINKANTLPKVKNKTSVTKKGWKFFGKDKSPTTLDKWTSDVDFNDHVKIEDKEEEIERTESFTDIDKGRESKGPVNSPHKIEEPITKIQDIYKDNLTETGNNKQATEII